MFGRLILGIIFVGASPVQLVRPSADHARLECVQDGLDTLRRIPAPVAVVSAVGAVHTGKSFLLNRLVDNAESQGFAVGYTVRPETKGLWMSSSAEAPRVLFLDTEGFFSPNVSDTYDAKMFAIATLMSSEVIYNTVKFIDSHHVELLELLIRRTNLFGLRAYARHSFGHETLSKEDNAQPPSLAQPVSNLAAFLRVLVPNQLSWVVQDFVQDLGKLQPEDWLNDLIERGKGQPEGSVGNFFKFIDCVPLPVPAGDSETLQKLDRVDPSQLDPSYVKAVRQFRQRLLQRALKRPKLKGGSHLPASGEENPVTSPMSGSDIANLLEFLVAAANNGPADEKGEQPFPQLPSIAEQFTALQVRLMRSDILAILEKDLFTAVERAYQRGRPLPRFNFEQEIDKAETQAHLLWSSTIKGLVSNAEVVSEVTGAEAEFLVGLEAVREKIVARNCELVDIWCKRFIDDLLEQYNDKLRELTQIPMLPALLESEMASAQNVIRKKYQSALAKDEGGWILKANTQSCCRGSTHEEFSRNLESLTQRGRQLNDRLIEDFFHTVLQDLETQWQQEVESLKQNSSLFTRGEEFLQDLFKSMRKNAIHAFAQDTSKYRGLFVHLQKQKELESLADKLETQVWKEWSAKCQQTAEDFLRTISIRYPYQLRRAISLPADSEMLENFMAAEANKLDKLFKDSVYCHNASVGRIFQRRFEDLLRDTAQSLRNQNIKTVKEITGQPLRDLKDELLNFATKFWLPQSFDAVAKRRALETLQKAMLLYESERLSAPDKMPQMSQVLLNSVAQDFVDTDLRQVSSRLIICRLIAHGFCITVLSFSSLYTLRAFRDHAWSDFVKWTGFTLAGLSFYSLQAFRTSLRQFISNCVFWMNETAMIILSVIVAGGVARLLYCRAVMPAEQSIPIVMHPAAGTPSYHVLPTTATPERYTTSTFPTTTSRPGGATSGGYGIADTYRAKHRSSFGASVAH